MRRAEVSLETGAVKLELGPDAPGDRELVNAVERQVIFPRLRQALASLPGGRKSVHSYHKEDEW